MQTSTELLKNFDLDRLDDFEDHKMHDQGGKHTKEFILQVMINSVEGDHSQLSDALREIAELQEREQAEPESKRDQNRIKILIEVSGGNIQLIASNSREVDIVIIDYDNLKEGDKPENLLSFQPDAVRDEMASVYNVTGIGKYTDEINAGIYKRLKELNF